METDPAEQHKEELEVVSCRSPELIYSVEDSIAEPIESTDDLDKHNGCTQEVSQSDHIPEVGNEFELEEDAEKFYNEYARRIGFSIRKSKVHRKFGVIVDRIFCCSREGFRKKDKRDMNVKKHCLESRFGCEAQMRIMMNSNGKYEVTQFQPIHNHELVPHTMVHILRSHRNLIDSQNVEVDIIDNSRIAPSTVTKFMGSQGGSDKDSVVHPVVCSRDVVKHKSFTQEVSQTDYVPKVGKVFESEEDAENFYNEYARSIGFSIRKSKVHRRFDVIVDRIFCCSREGFRRKDKRDKNVRKHRPETRVGCKAEMRVMVNSVGKYEVTHFEPTHNHELVLPPFVSMLRSHRCSTTSPAAKVCIANNSNVTPSSIMEFSSKQVGGHKKPAVTTIDCNNHLHYRWKPSMKKGDARGLLEYFKKKQLEDSFFFYDLQLDEDNVISNIFWADMKMMSDYNYFGDVVCLDTTYKTNEEDWPFGLFMGVNHHKQIVIFGVVLLYDEAIDAFKWLFKTFIQAMSGKRPRTVLTDQHQVMINAIKSVLPDTNHRLCIWHVYQNAIKKLLDVLQHNKPFSEDLQRCMYDFEDDEEFKEEWNKMVEKHHLQGNKWLDELFKEREKWALAYERNIFCADMSTTQRSESMNNVLKMLLNTSKDMSEFLGHFDRVLLERRYEELKADYKMSQCTPTSAGPILILDHAKSVYTPSIFEIFQGEVLQTLNCDAHICGEVGTTIEYKVSNGRSTRHREHTVSFDSSDSIVACSCKRFELIGILCRHALRVFHIGGIRKIPSRYILDRWRNDAKSVRIMANNQLGMVESNPAKRFRIIWHIFEKIAKRAARSKEAFDYVCNFVNQMDQQLDEVLQHAAIVEPSDVASSMQSDCEEFEHPGVQDVDAQCEGNEIIPINDMHSSALEKTTMQRRKRDEQNACGFMPNIVDKPKKAKGNQKGTIPMQSPIPSAQCFPKQHDPRSCIAPTQSFQDPNLSTNMCDHQNPNLDGGSNHGTGQMLLDSNFYHQNHSKERKGGTSYTRMLQPTLPVNEHNEPQSAKSSFFQESAKDVHNHGLYMS